MTRAPPERVLGSGALPPGRLISTEVRATQSSIAYRKLPGERALSTERDKRGASFRIMRFSEERNRSKPFVSERGVGPGRDLL